MKPIAIVILSTVGLVATAAIDGVLYSGDPGHWASVVGVFALIGTFLGTIYATDPRAGMVVQSRPLVRTVVSLAVGVLMGLLWSLSAPATALCVAIFAALGWLGMRWAKYVEF